MRGSRMFNIALLVGGLAYGIYQWQQMPHEAASSTAATSGQTPPELQQFIAHALKVYDAQNFAEIVTLMPPLEIQALQPRGKNLSPEELAKVLRERPEALATAAINFQELQAIQHKTPVMEDDGTRAVYKLDTPIKGQTQVVFVKIGSTWYKP